MQQAKDANGTDNKSYIIESIEGGTDTRDRIKDKVVERSERFGDRIGDSEIELDAAFERDDGSLRVSPALEIKYSEFY